jgi:16S rRNA (guanine527-N7)-methyltransferase
MNKFEQYFEFLISENEKYNLTKITEKEEVFIKHFDDSLAVADAVDLNNIETICDVGSGAGFPGVPLKIRFPHLKLTIIEPTKKRCQFLEKLVLKLQLDSVIILNERAENIKDLRESFDIVVARAVANLPMLIELCTPLVKVNGYFLALKGPHYQSEIYNSANALRLLSSYVEDNYTYELKKKYGIHTIIKIKKLAETDLKYPRNYKLIKSKPL